MKCTILLLQQASLKVEDLVEGFEFSETLNCACFEEFINDLFMKALGYIGRVFEDADVSKSEVDEIKRFIQK